MGQHQQHGWGTECGGSGGGIADVGQSVVSVSLAYFWHRLTREDRANGKYLALRGLQAR